MSENNIASANLFLEMAAFWRPPDEEFWNNISSGCIDSEISELVKQAKLLPEWAMQKTFQASLPPLAVLQSFFIRCFIGIGKKTALPVESIYKKWTEDPTARLPIAGSTGYLMGDPALHAQYLLEHYGLCVPPNYRMMPDHLFLLLELAAFLLKNRTSAEARTFLAQHLDWLDQLLQAVNEVESENEQDYQAKYFYQVALQFLQQMVDCQLRNYSNACD